MAEGVYDPLYLRGIEQFNQHRFFESHEVWEDLWIAETGPSRSFYKGLIQAAVAICHYENGNFEGARKLLLGATGLLDPYRPKHLGLDVDRFLGDLSRCLTRLLDPRPPELPPWSLALAPRIELDPAPETAAGVTYS
jgi:predicted metal-dependent hydrolase